MAQPPTPVPGQAPPPHPPRHRDRRSKAMGWRSQDILRTAALVIAMYVGVRLIWFVNPLVFTAFLSILFGLGVSAGVDRLQKFRIPRALGATLIVGGFIGALIAFGAIMAPTLREQSAVLKERLPQAIDAVERWVNAQQGGLLGMFLGGTEVSPEGGDSAAVAPDSGSGAVADTNRQPADTSRSAQERPGDSSVARADSAPSPRIDTAAIVRVIVDTVPAGGAQAGEGSPAESLRNRLGSQIGNVTRYLFPFLSSTIAIISGLFLIIFLTIFIAAEPDTYHRGMMHLFPHPSRKRAGEVLSRMATVLRKWLVTQMIGMATIGVVTTIVLMVLKVKAAIALGILAALLEFIPTIGPIISAVPAVAMAFLDSPEKALWVTLAYVVIQFLESNILIPMLMKEGMDLPPVLTILAQALMAVVFGFLGLLVAVPVLAAVMVPIKMLYVEGVVGDDLDEGDDEDED
jgi:predicted PurR-regulated permease PerM